MATDAVTRFSGFAPDYDKVRPTPPAELVRLLGQWIGQPAPRVVDLGAGTGLATAIWSGTAASVVAVEPSAQMRAIAEQRVADLPDAANFTFLGATAEDTGLPDECADVVVASQAMHWFDPVRALPEIARLLRPGGVFAAVDCDWPPTVHAEVDATYAAFEQRYRDLEDAHDTAPPHAEKDGHLGRMARSGLFRHTREICLHSPDTGDADRLLGLAHSQGGVVALLSKGLSEADLGLTALREIADHHLPTPTPWWWTYRVRLGWK